MNSIPSILLCLAYILGLFATGLPLGFPGNGLLTAALLVPLALLLPRWPRTRPLAPPRFWLVAAAIAVLATAYYQIRIPSPSSQDISKLVAQVDPQVSVGGTIGSLPHLTRSGKAQVWLDIQALEGTATDGGAVKSDQVRGRLYVTVQQVESDRLYPGERVTLSGLLYQPQAAKNPGGFDFKDYLARQGSFAGLRGETLEIPEGQRPGWGWWRLQQRIVRAQMQLLPNPEGQLISAMVLGGKVVDLPADLKDQFIQVGLAQVLAASGFQTSLILGVVLRLTARFSARIQVFVGLLALLVFVGLAGAEPSVLRATVMGVAVLVGIAVERKTKPIGSLLLSAVLLLIWNPLWIWDLGAQLSFLATLGLLVTSPWIEAELDWLPTAIAPLISVPIAAYIWTIPLQMQMFGVVSPYSILANVLTTPLVSALSLGGFASAILAIAQADLGSWSAWLLHYPTSWLLGIVDLCGRLPGNSIAVGTTPLLLTLVLYGTLGLLWWKPDLRRYSGALVLATMVLVFVPAWQVQANLVRITALVTADQPILVVQERGRVGLINSGQANTAQMTVLPFLQQQGINRLDWAVALQAGDGWEKVGVPIGSLYALDPAQIPQSLPLTDFQVGQVRVQRLNTEPPLIQVQVQNHSWLLAPQAPKATAVIPVAAPGSLPAAAILWWSGGRMPLGLPLVGGAIAYGKRLMPQTEQQLKALGAPVFWLRRDGAVQWTPRGGLAPAIREHLD